MTIRLFRYPITLHYSWFILFGLLTWGLSTEFIAQPTQDLSLAAHWALAAYTGGDQTFTQQNRRLGLMPKGLSR